MPVSFHFDFWNGLENFEDVFQPLRNSLYYVRSIESAESPCLRGSLKYVSSVELIG